MQVTKIRFANDNGLVPAGQYFLRLSDNLRAANARAAAVVEKYEAQERRLEGRHRGRRMAPRRSNASAEHPMTM